MPLASRRQFLSDWLATALAVLGFGGPIVHAPVAAQAEDLVISRDQRDGDMLSAIKKLLDGIGVKSVSGIGPISPDGSTCLVLLEDENNTGLPDTLKGELRNKAPFAVKLLYRKDMATAQLFADISSGGVSQFSGPLMGGDPIWNDATTQWGTISFAVGNGSGTKIEGQPCANQSISCDHVLNVGSTSISTPNFPSSMTLTWYRRSAAGNPWLDVGGASINGATPYVPLQVRGLGLIKHAKQPSTGIRVSKYGAATRLTSGRDLGLAWRPIDAQDPTRLYLIRRVSGYFSNVGDSGASVLDADRNLVGLVIGGKLFNGQLVLDETYYMQALPYGETAPHAELSVFTVENL